MARLTKKTPILTANDAYAMHHDIANNKRQEVVNYVLKNSKPFTDEFLSFRLTLIRSLNRMNETELGKQCQLSKQAISNYETGRRAPKEAYIMMFCSIFNVKREFFFNKSATINLNGNQFKIV